MKNMYKLLLILFLLPLAITATEKKGKYTKEKVINKEFNVNKDATLSVSNKFGNLDIITWNEHKISIKVTITTNGDNEEKVKDRLDQIEIAFEGNTSRVSAKTMIEKISNSWNFWGKKNNVNVQIDYLIKMPKSNNVDLMNDYGSINIDKLEGSAKINCDYGRLTIGELLNSDNKINIDYTNKSTIDFMKNGTVHADYSTLQIEKTEKVNVNADYSHISFGTFTDLEYDGDYGDLKVENAGNLKVNSDYMHINIKKLNGSGDFNIEYGSLKVNEISENTRNVKIESSYTNLKFGVNPNTAFHFTATLNYGGFKYVDGFNFTKEIVKSSSKYYEGYYNSSNSNHSIFIKSNYGSITFSNN